MNNHTDAERVCVYSSQIPEFNYDNCIITNHESSSDSFESNASYSEPINSRESENLNVQEQNITKSEEKHDDCYLNVNITLQDSFVLVIGFFNKLEKFFTKNRDEGCDEKTLNRELSVIKKLLINNSKNFGYSEIKNINGSLFIHYDNDDNINEEKMKNPQQEATSLQDKNETKDVNDDMKIKNVKKISKPRIKVKISKNKQKYQHNKSGKKLPTHRTKGGVKQNKQNFNNDNMIRRITRSCRMELSDKGKRGQKRKERLAETSSSLDLKPTKKAKVEYVHYNDRMIKVAANIRCAVTGEDFNTVANILKEESISGSLCGKKKVTKEKLSHKVAAPKSPRSSKIDKRSPTLSKEIIEKEITDADQPRNISLINRSLKRKLYSPDIWMDNLPSVLN